MKILNAMILFFGSITGFASTCPDNQHLRGVEPQTVFVPPGFDSDDNAQVVLRGLYPNTCWKPVDASVEKNDASILIRNQACFAYNDWCLFILVPYTHVVDLGTLKPGTYSVATASAEGITTPQDSLPIAAAKTTERPDAIQLAQVNQVKFFREKETERLLITLTGTVPDDESCQVFHDIFFEATRSQIVEVIPVVKTVALGCTPSKYKTLNETREVPTTWLGEQLFHIRSLDGKSIYKVITR